MDETEISKDQESDLLKADGFMRGGSGTEGDPYLPPRSIYILSLFQQAEDAFRVLGRPMWFRWENEQVSFEMRLNQNGELQLRFPQGVAPESISRLQENADEYRARQKKRLPGRNKTEAEKPNGLMDKIASLLRG
ncbi:MAG TPA: hypothetical protein VLH19_04595 [Patescibacteria group bacterium]|nr:hypothetical protein [Patescibacteria group bacterium]